MTLSPIENAHLSIASVAAFIVSQQRVFAGGVMTGPLFGWFGNRWRLHRHRGWRGALITAAAVSFEPLARRTAGYGIGSPAVLRGEVAVGIAMVAYVTARTVLAPRSERSENTL
jgi:hypothetical protein